MKNIFNYLTIVLALTFTSCTKDDPTPEQDQEEVGTATLTFTEVERESHGDHYHYNDIEDAEVEEIKFVPKDGKLLAPVGAHLHLEVGKTYRLELKATDFAGRETQSTFVSRADIHQAFLLGAPVGSLEYVYADKDANDKKVNVGVTGYITVVEESESFVFQYIMRHLNPGVKENITAADWNNKDYAKFTGATDLDLKIELHLVEEGHGGH